MTVTPRRPVAATAAMLVALVAALAVVTAGALGAVETNTGLRIVRATPGEDSSWDVLVTVPASLSRRDLPSSAFSATDPAGAALPARAIRRAPGDLDVAVIVDNGNDVTESDLMATKAATADFVIGMPPEVRIAAVPAVPPPSPSTPPELTADRRAVLRALGQIAPGDRAADLGAALRDVAHAMPAGRRSAVVVVSLDPRDTAAMQPDAALGDVVVYVIGAAQPAAAVTQQTGGLALAATHDMLVAAFDAAAADLLGRYDVHVDAVPAGSAVTVHVSDPLSGVSDASATFETAPPSPASPSTGAVAPPATASSPTAPSRDSGLDGAELAAVAIGGLVVLAVLVALWWYLRAARRRAPRAPAGAGPATAAVPAPAVTPIVTVLGDPGRFEELRERLAEAHIVAVRTDDPVEAMVNVVQTDAAAVLIDTSEPDSRRLAEAVRRRRAEDPEQCTILGFAPPEHTPAVPENLVDGTVEYPVRADEVAKRLAGAR